MCGIAGAYILENARNIDLAGTKARVGRMLEAMNHRGPDDQGLWSSGDGRVVLGHRRLAIVDLSPAGHQPMALKDRFTIAFNGEIYNFRDIRAELVSAGVRFHSESDTEVILNSVAQWGLEVAIKKFVGMFAFVMWDSSSRVLHLVRDRFGEKPLFMSERDGVIYFASEARAFRSLQEWKGRLSTQAVEGYLLNGYVPGCSSIIEGVYRLPAASAISMHIGAKPTLNPEALQPGGSIGSGVTFLRYWSDEPRAELNELSLPIKDAVDNLDSLLRVSIADQLRCDVPVGVFLSSGVDSALVAGLAQAISDHQVSTYTISFSQSDFDESGPASEIAKHLGTRHTVIPLDAARIPDEIPGLAMQMDEPTGNASFIPLAIMSRAARQHVKVVLTGDGGDELFAGYNRYRSTLQLWSLLGRLPLSVRRAAASLLPRSIPAGLFKPLIAILGKGVGTQVSIESMMDKIKRLATAATLGEGYCRLLSCWDSSFPFMPRSGYAPPTMSTDVGGFLQSAMRFDRSHYMQDDNLAKSDRATMLASIEARVPMLDHRVVEFASTLPKSYLVSDGRSKVLLRELARRYVPAALLERPKMGFSVPMDAWLRGPLREWAGEALRKGATRGIMNGARGIQLIERDYYDRRNVTAWQMWTLVTLCAWLD